jgi:hypothetical protein
MICGRSPVLGGRSARSRVCICGKLWTSGASAAVAAWSVVRWIIGAACVEGQKLVRNLYAALGVYKDDHVQRAVEVVALLHCEGFVALQESVPVALKLGDTLGASPDLLRLMFGGSTDVS